MQPLTGIVEQHNHNDDDDDDVSKWQTKDSINIFLLKQFYCCDKLYFIFSITLHNVLCLFCSVQVGCVPLSTDGLIDTGESCLPLHAAESEQRYFTFYSVLPIKHIIGNQILTTVSIIIKLFSS